MMIISFTIRIDVIDCNFTMLNTTNLLNVDDILYNNSQPALWLNDDQIDTITQQLDLYGFCIVDHMYSPAQLTALREECLAHQTAFRQAEIQNGRMQDIRSDHILWIDQHLPHAQTHLSQLLHLGQMLNRAFYLGIYEIEGHFAHYHAGEFYKLHRDNPQHKNGRIISTVYYLHQDWQHGDGGELRLQDKQNQWHSIQPLPNRLVIFQSDLLHEVLINQRDRLSITAWLRQRNSG